MHTICTHTNKTIMQHIEDNREENTEQDNTEQHIDTETNNHAQDNAQPQHRCSAHNFSTYSLDYYNEYVCIKNSDTIEIYTILK